MLRKLFTAARRSRDVCARLEAAEARLKNRLPRKKNGNGQPVSATA